MIRAGVIGATGYAGAELVRILAGHPRVELTRITSRQYEGRPYSQIYPCFKAVVDLTCKGYDADTMARNADVVFTALPHKLPMEIVPGLLEKGIKVVDLSADFRFGDAGIYEAHYQPHTARHLLKRAVYGLTEVYGAEISAARLVGNPGCYPTSLLLPLIPLLRRDLIDPTSIIADAKSGVSGAGRAPSLGTHHCEVNEALKAYKVNAHRHTPEMETVISREAGRAVAISFTPHLIPMTRGMLTTLYAGLAPGVTETEVRHALEDTYAEQPFVRVCAQGEFPNTIHVKGTNFCDIGFGVDQRTSRLIVVSVIDNLVKGAAGQAVQNMNVMLGWPQETGLLAPPYPL
jgi:N-acetyl-gamma-glutamyl-phosphate reductase